MKNSRKNRLTKKASFDNLDAMIDFVILHIEEKFCLTIKQNHEMRILCEEVLVNVIRYAYDNEGDMTVELEYDRPAKAFILRFIDSGIQFNPLAQEEPDIAADVRDRQVGGLGILMIRRMADSVEYERVENQNRLTIMKHFH